MPSVGGAGALSRPSPGGLGASGLGAPLAPAPTSHGTASAGPALPRAAAGFWYNSALRDVDMHPGHKSLFDGLFSQLRVPTRVRHCDAPVLRLSSSYFPAYTVACFCFVLYGSLRLSEAKAPRH